MALKHPSKLIVFCGPSLSATRATELAPGADVRPPIRRGDLAKIVQDATRPETILIIDGCFFGTESVSLIEIREAIAKGWRIFGASSMGALRAIEAGPVGMKGLGIVYRWIRLFKVEDDDEVAQTVNPVSHVEESLAMIDIRAVLRQLVKQHKLSREESRRVVQVIKKQYFPQRTLHRLQTLLKKTAAHPPELHSFTRLKERDAASAISLLWGQVQ